MIIRVASPKVASPSNDFLRFELQWITLKPSPGLGLELSLLDLAPWSLRCLSAQSDGCIDDSKRSCHPMSFLVLSSAHPYGTLFSNVSQRVLKAETAGSNCFLLVPCNVFGCHLLQEMWFQHLFVWEVAKDKRLAVASLIMSLLRYIRLVHLRLNAAARGFRSSELNSLEMVCLTQVSNAASLSVIVWWLSCSKMPPSTIQDMDYSFLLILIHLKFYMLM